MAPLAWIPVGTCRADPKPEDRHLIAARTWAVCGQRCVSADDRYGDAPGPGAGEGRPRDSCGGPRCQQGPPDVLWVGAAPRMMGVSKQICGNRVMKLLAPQLARFCRAPGTYKAF